MSDREPTKIPQTQEETRDFIADEAEACVALLQPALSAMAERWAQDPDELARVRKMGQIAAVRGLGEWMLDAFRGAGAGKQDVLAVMRLTTSMTEAFTRQAAAQAAVIAEEEGQRS